MKLPYGLAAWFPLIETELIDPLVLGVGESLDPQAVETAWDSCRRGQALVLVDEVHGPWKQALLTRFGRRARTAKLERKLARQGQSHRWLVMPSTGGSHVLLPPNSAGFRAGTPVLPAGRRVWRVARRLLQMAASFGLASRFGFGEVLVAIKGSGESIPASPWVAQRPGSCVAVSLGVPGYLRKATLRVCDDRGEVQGFLKVALGPGANPRVAHEAQTLKGLASSGLAEDLAPRLLDSGSFDGAQWLVQSPLEGQRSPDTIEPEHVAFLSGLARVTGARIPGSRLPLLLRSREHLDSLQGVVDEGWWTTMNELHESLWSHLEQVEVPCALSHGDFTPWNLAHSPEGIAAFDWEFAEREAPILADLVHFHLQTGILVRRVGAGQLLDELLALLDGGARELLSSWGLQSGAGPIFVALEVLRAATDDEALHQLERPPFEQVEWLRETRQALAVRLSARLRPGVGSAPQEVLAA